MTSEPHFNTFKNVDTQDDGGASNFGFSSISSRQSLCCLLVATSKDLGSPSFLAAPPLRCNDSLGFFFLKITRPKSHFYFFFLKF